MIEISIDPVGFLLIGVVFLIGVWNTSVGSTGGIVFATLSAVLGPAAAIPIQAVVEGISGLFRGYTLRAHVDRTFLRTFVLGAIPGFAIGLVLVRSVTIPEWLLNAGVGGFILLATWVPIARAAAVGRSAAPAIGAVTSFLSLFVGGMGAPISTGIHASGAEQKTVIATSNAALMVQYVAKLGVFGLAGFSFASFADLMIVLTLASLAGTWLGGKVLISVPEALIRRVFKVLVTVIGGSLVVRSAPQLLCVLHGLTPGS